MNNPTILIIGHAPSVALSATIAELQALLGPDMFQVIIREEPVIEAKGFLFADIKRFSEQCQAKQDLVERISVQVLREIAYNPASSKFYQSDNRRRGKTNCALNRVICKGAYTAPRRCR